MNKENAYQAWLDETQKYGSGHREAFEAGYAAGAAEQMEKGAKIAREIYKHHCYAYDGGTKQQGEDTAKAIREQENK